MRQHLHKDKVHDQQLFEKQVPPLFHSYACISTIGCTCTCTHTHVYMRNRSLSAFFTPMHVCLLLVMHVRSHTHTHTHTHVCVWDRAVRRAPDVCISTIGYTCTFTHTHVHMGSHALHHVRAPMCTHSTIYLHLGRDLLLEERLIVDFVPTPADDTLHPTPADDTIHPTPAHNTLHPTPADDTHTSHPTPEGDTRQV